MPSILFMGCIWLRVYDCLLYSDLAEKAKVRSRFLEFQVKGDRGCQKDGLSWCNKMVQQGIEATV